ncbi:MAG: type II-A CRISPR-associated protein Csn2 [Lachnospiraceae bacterium]|nr:type II-A CRISPR-associated protein Csn2 [Lachnospiraceae bacterium]
MRLLHQDFRFVFEFEENTKNLLVVECPDIFCKMVRELSSDDLMEEGRFVLSEDETPVKKKDQLLCVVNPLAVSLNERKLSGKLMDALKKEIGSSELLLESNQIIALLENYASNIIQNADWELTCSEKLDVSGLLKFLGIQFQDEQGSLLEKLTDYIKVTSDLLGTGCFVFVHLLSYLTEYEMEKFFEYAHYYKIYILLLESKEPEIVKKFTNVAIIDKDACEIRLNM